MARKLRSMSVLVALLAVTILLTGCLGGTKAVSPTEIKQFLTEFANALSTRDIEALVDLHSFPVETYDDDDVLVKMTREEFLAHLEEFFAPELEEGEEITAAFGQEKIYIASDDTVIVEVTLNMTFTPSEGDTEEQSLLAKLSLKKINGKWKLQRAFYLEFGFTMSL